MDDTSYEKRITPEEIGAMFRTMRFDCIIVWLIGLLDALRADWKSYEGHGQYSPADYIVRYIAVQAFEGAKKT